MEGIAFLAFLVNSEQDLKWQNTDKDKKKSILNII